MGITKTVAGVAQPLKNAGWARELFEKLMPTTGNKMSLSKNQGYKDRYFLTVFILNI
ncbi:MAG: hypothetical protein IPP81_08810 [Chitinophagaceae bacterium]|nr:hypothetical protein [Chitinophagaceae bacterium]